MHAPLEDHIEAVMRILRYLKATSSKGLLFSINNHMCVEAYVVRLVGKLIYLSHIWPGIAYVVRTVFQFMHAPLEDHIEVVMRILRYLKATSSKGLLFSINNHMCVEAYIDVDWGGSMINKRSTSRYYTFVGSNLVTWRSKKQLLVARSSVEAEFRTIALGIYEHMWIKSLLK